MHTSGPFRVSPLSRFYKSHSDVPLRNPLRRWLYHRIAAVVSVVCIGGAVLSYRLAAWEARRNGPGSPRFICPNSLSDFLYLLPTNFLSNIAGQLAESGPVPKAVHEKCVAFLVWFYGIDLADCEVSEFDSLQDFYSRRWAVGSRPLAKNAAVVAPCDGEVLAVHEDVSGASLVRVKGLTYSVPSLFRESPPETPRGYKRVIVVLHLRTQDYHHVVAPVDFTCEGSVYVPGALLPMTAAGYHWLPGGITANERVVVHGHTDGKSTAYMALAMVGSTLTGRISLAFDRRIRTNFLDPPDYAVHLKYSSQPHMRMGADIGSFQWGSSVALLVDVPEKLHFHHKVGDCVKAGQLLIG